jgi:hypothetical protein
MKPVSQGYTDMATLKRKPGLLKGFIYLVKKRENSFADVESTPTTDRKSVV